MLPVGIDVYIGNESDMPQWASAVLPFLMQDTSAVIRSTMASVAMVNVRSREANLQGRHRGQHTAFRRAKILQDVV